MIYRFVTSKQKKFLIKTCEALGITLDDLMEVQNINNLKQNIKDLEEKNNLLNTALQEQNKSILAITQVVTSLQAEILNMQNEEILREMNE